MKRSAKIAIVIAIVVIIAIIAAIFIINPFKSQTKDTNTNTNSNTVQVNTETNTNTNIQNTNNANQPYSETTSNISNDAGNTTTETPVTPDNTIVTDETRNYKYNSDSSVRTVETDPRTDLDKTRMVDATRNFMNAYINFNDIFTRKSVLSNMLDISYIASNPETILYTDYASDYTESKIIHPDMIDIYFDEPQVHTNYAGDARCLVVMHYTRVFQGDDGGGMITRTETERFHVYLNKDYKVWDLRRA